MTVLKVVAVVGIVRASRGGSGPTDARRSFDQRYACGEVPTEEPRERIEQLTTPEPAALVRGCWAAGEPPLRE